MRGRLGRLKTPSLRASRLIRKWVILDVSQVCGPHDQLRGQLYSCYLSFRIQLYLPDTKARKWRLNYRLNIMANPILANSSEARVSMKCQSHKSKIGEMKFLTNIAAEY
jgi:hypothetical protein